MPIVPLARHAMATRFEFVLQGDDPVALRAAGEEALAEIERLEAQLSLFVPTSEIAHVNARAAKGPVRVSVELFSLLQRARQLHQETGGAFDITIAPLLRCWGFLGGSGRLPNEAQLAEARGCVGMEKLQLDAGERTVRFLRDGMMLDLGAIGKGYAIERAAEILREAGIRRALLHGGTSTVYGLGRPLEGEAWRIGLQAPPAVSLTPALKLPVVALHNEALSVSAQWGKSFEAGGQTYGHVLDPRTGRPVAHGAVLAAVITASATDADALSTALLVLGAAAFEPITACRPGLGTVVVSRSPQGDSMTIGGAREVQPPA
jgi:thiamine biosynthesis lipoprotein